MRAIHRDLQTTPDTQDHVNDDNTDDEDQWLQQYLLSKPGPLSLVLSAVIDEVTWSEQRTRKRRAKDAETFHMVVDIVVSNMARSLLRHPGGHSLIVCRDTGGRRPYDNPAIPRATFVQTLDLLEGAGFITQTIGAKGKGLTTIRATDRLAALVSGFGVDLGCFRFDRRKPLIIVNSKADRGPRLKPSRAPVAFDPTPETERMGAEVARLNAFLAGSDLGFIPDGLGTVDTNDRALTRRFVVLSGQGLRFDQVGRLYGGFWQGLQRHRRGNLRIEGETIADLDFVSLHPRLAYCLQGQECPPGDLYDLTGLLEGFDRDNRDHRDAAKQGLCSCLNGGRAGASSGQPSHLDALPPGTTAADLRAALKLRHPGLAPIIDPQEPPKVPLGYRLMMTESTILLTALDRLMSARVVALPSHDGLFVSQSKAQIAREVLQAASLAVVGVCLSVQPKGVPEPTQAILRPIHPQPIYQHP